MKKSLIVKTLIELKEPRNYHLQVQEDKERRKSWKTTTVLYGLWSARAVIPFRELLDCQTI